MSAQMGAAGIDMGAMEEPRWKNSLEETPETPAEEETATAEWLHLSRKLTPGAGKTCARPFPKT
jgi:hypothetical protein